MDFSLMQRVFPFFVEAALVTLELTALALVLGLAVAALAATARMSRSAVLRAIGTLYVSLFRGTPCLIQLFVLYFGGPQIGINLDPFAAGVIGLGLNIGAYMAESIRGAVVAVDRGQTEAARTIGFGRFQTLRKVVLPQAARLMIRPLGVNTVALLKGSALVSTISVVELTYTAQRFIGSTYKPFEIFGVAALLYMVMVYAVARIVDMLDKRFAII
ncbi:MULTISPECIES: amino acid ABC transporter permease [unclassified Mesorhizobium]|uniref:amino acid ABC transporter permease n=1 Tax=unclassified Mesorhizobium TaxID=325217 RepID=UPI0011286F8D|nr:MULTISPECIES: amino acid ABC transporter permease [unclassified Mesorhizobium]TPJ45794.1 amino acid ABC transporter permease [Mesorhizobium sp. B2-6-6]MBZ9955987.1 amino acid ABC transporter permease [Mesorhizobium sp. BR1-1-15]MBZ9998650.1 amino acid ABC transporter permease [Mesorhizobium sp. B264B2A]MCA0005195.1 amino acid ABC transporter permease [Mesorhizobium sp. B264B1B]MCA0017301.1 amino acid ABC transporter permease [Mesorhizobium sp. B264B1A]